MNLSHYIRLFQNILHIPLHRRLFFAGSFLFAIFIYEANTEWIKILSISFVAIVFFIFLPMEILCTLKEKEIRMFDNLANPENRTTMVRYTGIVPRLTQSEIDKIARKYPWVEIYHDEDITPDIVYKVRRAKATPRPNHIDI